MSGDQQNLWNDLAAAAKPQRTLAERPLDEWPASQQPTERIYAVGPAGLSDIEILALIIGPKAKPNPITIAQAIYQAAGSSWLGLHQLSITELAVIPGSSREIAARIKAALDVWRRTATESLMERKQITSPSDAANLLMAEMSHLEQEHLRVICLDTKNRVQKVHTVYIGSLDTALVRVGEVFKEPIRLNSASLILCHNHPSGDPTPSPQDTFVTRAVVQAGQLLDIEVTDHLVIGQGSYVSMRERGLGFPK
jgi:DNA repair protein RadC